MRHPRPRPPRPPALRLQPALALAVLLATLVSPLPSAGQDLGTDLTWRNETVAAAERRRVWDSVKSYGAERIADRDLRLILPDGVRVGNYLLFPSVEARTIYDDNVFRANGAQKKADVIYELAPVVRVQSQLPRHALDLAFGGRLRKFSEHEDLDTADAFASIAGALHFDHAHTLATNLLSELEHDDRFRYPTPANPRAPARYWHNRAAFSLKRDAGKAWASIGFTAESWDYFDVRSVTGPMIDQDNRDSATFSSSLHLGYRVSPALQGLVHLRGLRQYALGLDGTNRDAFGYELTAGLMSEISPLLRWRLVGGYGIRDFDRAGLAEVGRFLAEGELQWLATQQLTFYATLRRSIADDSGGRSDIGIAETSLAARLDYEVRRNLFFTFGAEYRDTEYIGLNQRDQTIIGRIGVDYHHAKNWLFTFGLEHEDRQSSVSAYEMSRNRVWLGAKLRF
jgi:hypothetical protein